MTAVKAAFAVACVVAQVLFFIGILFLFSDLYGLRFLITPAIEQSPMLLAPYVKETVISYWPVYGIGLVGAIANFLLVSRFEYRAAWFLKVTRIISWFWIPLIPIGTLAGIILLGAARKARARG